MLTSKAVLVQLLLVLTLLTVTGNKRKSNYRYDGRRATMKEYTKTMCMNMDSTLRARHKTCFLRPDTGPCRADIIQWYYDVKQRKCFRFFWGGCQGNGNKFDSRRKCMTYCYLNSTPTASPHVPFYCQLTFDYGSCFGQYNRWAFDRYSGMCRFHLYSGCGGNQNNFETREECQKNCLTPPNNTMHKFHRFTTCFPFDFDGANR